MKRTFLEYVEHADAVRGGRLDEGMREWLLGLAMAAGLIGGGYGAYRGMTATGPAGPPTKTWTQQEIESLRSIGHESGKFFRAATKIENVVGQDLAWRFSKAWLNRGSNHAAYIKAYKDVSVAYAKGRYGVAEADMKFVTLAEYLRDGYGDGYDDEVRKAKQYNLPSDDKLATPNISRIDQPVLLVRDKGGNIMRGYKTGAAAVCETIGEPGFAEFKVCIVSEEKFGDNEHSREEMTHALQDAKRSSFLVQKEDLENSPYVVENGRRLKGFAGYLYYSSNTVEFVAKLAELKRAYYKATGRSPESMQDIINHFQVDKLDPMKNRTGLPTTANGILALYKAIDSIRDPARRAELMRSYMFLGDQYLPGIVMSGLEDGTRRV